MQPLLYRHATSNDLSKIVEIYNSTVALRMVTADTEPVTAESKLNWFNKHSPDKRLLLIIENEIQNILLLRIPPVVILIYICSISTS